MAWSLVVLWEFWSAGITSNKKFDLLESMHVLSSGVVASRFSIQVVPFVVTDILNEV